MGNEAKLKINLIT